jgi:hypothetical protein
MLCYAATERVSTEFLSWLYREFPEGRQNFESLVIANRIDPSIRTMGFTVSILGTEIGGSHHTKGAVLGKRA